MAKTKKPTDDFSKFLPDDGVPTEIVNTPIQVAEHQGTPPDQPSSPVVVQMSPSVISNLPTNIITGSHMGAELPPVSPKEGTDPLIVEAYKMFRTLRVGGLISPYSGFILEQVDDLMKKLEEKVVV